MSDLARELRQALRRLWRAPGFTLVTILTLGLGIGACTAIYTVVYGVLLQPLPYAEPDRLVAPLAGHRERQRRQLLRPELRGHARSEPQLRALAEYTSGTVSVVGGAAPVRTRMAIVSGAFFDVFGTRPRHRPAASCPTSSARAAAPAVLVSHAFWQQTLARRARPRRPHPHLRPAHLHRRRRDAAVVPLPRRRSISGRRASSRSATPPARRTTGASWAASRAGVTLAQARDDVRAHRACG